MLKFLLFGIGFVMLFECLIYFMFAYKVKYLFLITNILRQLYNGKMNNYYFKTTLINIILGLLQPDKGQILTDGKSVYDGIRSWQNQIGYVPQNIYLNDDSIKKNIAFGISNVHRF